MRRQRDWAVAVGAEVGEVQEEGEREIVVVEGDQQKRKKEKEKKEEVKIRRT